MCGIVGYYGPENPKDVIVKGLKSLEYRGYDSAGVAILDHGNFKRVRAEGKLANLEMKLKNETFDGHLGIGHTRWATHGRPSERNAHPHCVDGVSIVHNGIIENYAELREELNAEKAVTFDSDTDSELVAHLLAREVKKGAPLLKAVFNVLPRLRGAYAILAVSKDQPDEIVAFKNGPPLILGVAKDAVLIASDVQALITHTKKIVYLNDNEIVSVKGVNWTIYNPKGEKLNRELTEINWNTEQAEKQGYKHYMLKEIYEQPRAVAQALAPHLRTDNHTVELNKVGFDVPIEKLKDLDASMDWQNTLNVLKGVERVFIVACGTSFYAGLVGKYLIEKTAKIPVECDIASEFRYRSPVIPPNTLLITISQSGETADTLAALRLAKEMGVRSLSLCNVRNSSIDREASGHLYLNSGVEMGVASTKAFSGMLAMMNVIAMALAKAKGRLSGKEETDWAKTLLVVPSHLETVLAFDKFFSEAASTLAKFKGFLYMGRGVHYPIALEGALKLKELAYMHAEGYAAGEMKHGPLALIDENMAIVMLAPQDDLYEKTVSNLEEAKARGGKIISIGSGIDEKLKRVSDHYIPLPKVPWMVAPLLEVVPLQLLAYHVADRMGHDVDQPRNLAKSVTVE